MPHPAGIDLQSVSFGNVVRYLAVWRQQALVAGKPLPKIYTKLYLDQQARDADVPQRGFLTTAPFQNACGPIAAMNLFKWYGIDQVDSVTIDQLRIEMKTNDWRIFGRRCSGTNTPNFLAAIQRHVNAHCPSGLELNYKHDGSNENLYNALEDTLAHGHPIAVDFRNGPQSGHMDLIIGMQKVPDPGPAWGGPSYSSHNNDLVIFANYDAMPWSEFVHAWKRSYRIFEAEVLSLAGEHPYVRIFLFPKKKAPLGDDGGGGGRGGGGRGAGGGHERGDIKVK